MDALWQLLFKTDSFVEGYGQENNNNSQQGILPTKHQKKEGKEEKAVFF